MGGTSARRLGVLTAAVVLLTVMMGLPAGCGEKATEERLEAQMEEALRSEGADVEVKIEDDESGSISISGDDGDSQISFGSTADVPEGFPPGLLPDDVDIRSSLNMDEGGEVLRTVTFTADADLDEMYEWFLEALPEVGYQIEQKTQFDTDEGRSFSITGSASEDGCTVTGTEQDGQFVGSVMSFSE